MTEVTVQTEEKDAPVIVFMKDKHELSDLFKKLDKASKEAVKTLQSLMETSVDEKVKMQCAEKILSFYTATAKQISDDEMTRLLAQVKHGGLLGTNVPLTDGEKKPKPPKLDFESIREV